MADTEAQDQATEQAEKKKEKKVYRKDKPWDNDSIDHWKINEWTEDDAKASSHFLEVEPSAVYATVFCVPSHPILRFLKLIHSYLNPTHRCTPPPIPHCHCCRLNRPSRCLFHNTSTRHSEQFDSQVARTLVIVLSLTHDVRSGARTRSISSISSSQALSLSDLFRHRSPHSRHSSPSTARNICEKCGQR